MKAPAPAAAATPSSLPANMSVAAMEDTAVSSSPSLECSWILLVIWIQLPNILVSPPASDVAVVLSSSRWVSSIESASV